VAISLPLLSPPFIGPWSSSLSKILHSKMGDEECVSFFLYRVILFNDDVEHGMDEEASEGPIEQSLLEARRSHPHSERRHL